LNSNSLILACESEGTTKVIVIEVSEAGTLSSWATRPFYTTASQSIDYPNFSHFL